MSGIKYTHDSMVKILCASICGLALGFSSALAFSAITGYSVASYFGVSLIIGLLAFLGGWVMGRSFQDCSGTAMTKAIASLLALLLAVLAIIVLVLSVFATQPQASQLALSFIGPVALAVLTGIRKAFGLTKT